MERGGVMAGDSGRLVGNAAATTGRRAERRAERDGSSLLGTAVALSGLDR